MENGDEKKEIDAEKNEEEEKKVKGNEIKVEDKKIINFDSYDEPKNIAYLENKEHFKKLKGKNNYEGEFFLEYLFEPNLSSFSETKIKINCEEFNDHINEVLLKFQSSEKGINPFNLLKKLKWQS